MSKARNTSLIWGVALTFVVAVVVVIAVWPDPNPYAGLDGDSILSRVEEANASLEDQTKIIDPERKLTGFKNAESLLLELRDALPTELLPLRNLAVLRAAQLVANLDLEGEEQQRFLTETDQVLNDLRKLPGQEGAAAYLRSRIVFKLNGDVASQASLDAINKALEASPDEVKFWGWKVFILETIRDDEPNRDAWIQQRHEAIEKAWQLDPSNLYVLGQSLVSLVEQKDAAAIKRIDEGKELIAALRYPVLKSNPRNDPYVYLDRLASEVESGNWDAAETSAGFSFQLIKNTLGLYNFDSNRATGHPLDLMVYRLSDEFYERVGGSPYQPPSKSIQWREPETLPGFDDAALDLVIADVDLDQKPDCVVLTASRLVVLKNVDGTFEVMVETEFEQPGLYQRLIATDLDQDELAKINDSGAGDAMDDPDESPEYFPADPDFILWGTGGVRVVLNADDQGRERSLETVVMEAEDRIDQSVVCLAACDIDVDADIDLVVSTEDGLKVLLNRGTGVFFSGTDYSSLEAVEGTVQSLSVVDWDRDLDLDLVTSSEIGLGLLENALQGRLRYRRLEEIKSSGTPIAAAALEADGIPSWDLLVGYSEGKGQVSTTQTHKSVVSQIGMHAVEFAPTERGRADDLDNDGVQDWIDLKDGRLLVSQGAADGSFSASEEVEGVLEASGFWVYDWDRDGLLDLVVATKSGIKLVKNQTDTDSAWVVVSLIGDMKQTGRVPRDALGTTAELRTNDRYQAKVVIGQQTHFGLGQTEQLAAIRILWSNGMPQSVVTPEIRTTIMEPIYLKGSCPFLYTWDGEKYVFVTDCLWAAPLGLLQSKDRLMPSREWEYLKIPGEMLKRNGDGRYQVQLTEELWEAAYFDQVRLIAVDHPVDVDIYSNEKVGPPSISQYKVHTVKDRHTPRVALGTRGEDVLDQISKADEIYYKGFRQRVVQGLVDEHWLELDLGDVSQASELMLYLRGWIHPTDTSLNVSFTDHPDRNAPQPPVVWYQDATGKWQPWEAPIGFPGGKTKTIAVDLSELAPQIQGRIRLVTTAEIYWDEAFFTVDDTQTEIREIELNVESANLHYRGYSARRPQRSNAPEVYDYDVVESRPAWAPMQGRFTRYGEVGELLLKTDDQMVVMGSGDEMTVTFEPLAEDPPEGWTRDFILHGVGWDKDADLNTILGQDTEPLPYAGMGGYPYSSEQKNWEIGELAKYFSRYQIRESDWSGFWKSPYWAEDASKDRVKIEP